MVANMNVTIVFRPVSYKLGNLQTQLIQFTHQKVEKYQTVEIKLSLHASDFITNSISHLSLDCLGESCDFSLKVSKKSLSVIF